MTWGAPGRKVGALGLRQARPKRSAVGAWISYDIANTVWWTGVLGVSFPLWLTNDMGGDDATWGYTVAATMTVVLLLSPILGSISDQSGRRMPLLIFTTIACIAATLMLGTGGLLSSLVLLAFAFCAMELGAIFYNSLLSEVSTEANRGLISGLGTGHRVPGIIHSRGNRLRPQRLPGAYPRDAGGGRPVSGIRLTHFLPGAGAVWALRTLDDPGDGEGCFRPAQIHLGRPPPVPGTAPVPAGQAHVRPRRQHHGGLRRGLRFSDSGDERPGDPTGPSGRHLHSHPQRNPLGRLVDRIGARPVLSLALLLWIGLLIFAVAIAWGSWTRHLWWGLGCITGLAMSGIWTADRPYMLSFNPPQYLGEFFGLHGMVGKLGRVIGPFGWALISGTLGFGQPVAVLCLAVCIVVSYVILTRIPAPVASPYPDRQTDSGDRAETPRGARRLRRPAWSPPAPPVVQPWPWHHINLDPIRVSRWSCLHR